MENDKRVLKSYSISLLMMSFISFMVFIVLILVLCGVVKQGQLAKYDIVKDQRQIVLTAFLYLIQGLINSYLGLSGINQVNGVNKNYLHIKICFIVIVLIVIRFLLCIYELYKGYISNFELIYQACILMFTLTYYDKCKKLKGD